MSEKQREFRLHNGQTGSALAVRVIPRASRNEISEILDDGTVKVRLTAPPVEGKANEALLTFLAEVLGVPSSSLEIAAGAVGKDKLVIVHAMDSASLQQKILLHLS